MMIQTPNFESVAAITQGNIPSHGFPQSSKYADMENVMANAANPAATISIAVNNGSMTGVPFNGSIPDLISSMSLAAENIALIREHAAKMQCEARKDKQELQRQAAAKAKPAKSKSDAKGVKTAEAIQDHVQELSLFERANARHGDKSKGGAEADAVGDGIFASVMEALKGGGEDITARISGAVSSMKDIGMSLVPEHSTPVAEVASAKSESPVFGSMFMHEADLGNIQPSWIPSLPKQPQMALAA